MYSWDSVGSRKNFLSYLFQFELFRDMIRQSPSYIRNYIEKITDFKTDGHE